MRDHHHLRDASCSTNTNTKYTNFLLLELDWPLHRPHCLTLRSDFISEHFAGRKIQCLSIIFLSEWAPPESSMMRRTEPRGWSDGTWAFRVSRRWWPFYFGLVISSDPALKQTFISRWFMSPCSTSSNLLLHHAASEPFSWLFWFL